MSDDMLIVDGLIKRFGEITAVDGIGFTLKRGEVLGFLGPNGAGKSTTMKMITGFLEPDAGSVAVCGYDMADAPIDAKRRIGYLPEGAPLYPDMTPLQFLNFVAEARNLDSGERKAAIDKTIESLHLESVLHQRIETLSKGFKRRVGLALALVHDPQVLVLDEPTDGLDPNQKQEVRELIRSMASEKAIIISTHILEEVEPVCSRAMIIDRGKVVVDGAPSTLIAQSPLYNAVTLTVAEARVAAVRDALRKLSDVDRVTEKQVAGNLIEFTALPKDGASIVQSVNRAANAENWDVEQLYIHPGRLDDYFRAVTQGDIAP